MTTLESTCTPPASRMCSCGTSSRECRCGMPQPRPVAAWPALVGCHGCNRADGASSTAAAMLLPPARKRPLASPQQRRQGGSWLPVALNRCVPLQETSYSPVGSDPSSSNSVSAAPAEVTSMAKAPNGQQLAVGYADGSVGDLCARSHLRCPLGRIAALRAAAPAAIPPWRSAASCSFAARSAGEAVERQQRRVPGHAQGPQGEAGLAPGRRWGCAPHAAQTAQRSDRPAPIKAIPPSHA